MELEGGVDDDLTNDVASLRAILNEAAPSTSQGTAFSDLTLVVYIRARARARWGRLHTRMRLVITAGPWAGHRACEPDPAPKWDRMWPEECIYVCHCGVHKPHVRLMGSCAQIPALRASL